MPGIYMLIRFICGSFKNNWQSNKKQLKKLRAELMPTGISNKKSATWN